MSDILHRVGVIAPLKDVHAALTTIDGLAGWWTEDTKGDPNEVIGTHVSFRLSQADEYTIILFKHEGWREPVDFMYHCSTKWATFLMSLKQYVETGKGDPAPNDVLVSNWH